MNTQRLAVVLLIVVVAEPVVMTFAIMLTYVLSGPVGFVLTWPRRRRLEVPERMDRDTPPSTKETA